MKQKKINDIDNFTFEYPVVLILNSYLFYSIKKQSTIIKYLKYSAVIFNRKDNVSFI